MAKKGKKPPPGRATTRGNDGENIDEEVGRRIRLIRVQRNISQMELAAVLGVSFQQVQKYEKGTNRVATGRLVQIATYLKTSPHELIGWNTDEQYQLIDVETYKLAKEFSSLRPTLKGPVRNLITTLIEEGQAPP